jgi:DNA-directed RNA polymerase subunit RPC12/RpoP
MFGQPPSAARSRKLDVALRQCQSLANEGACLALCLTFAGLGEGRAYDLGALEDRSHGVAMAFPIKVCSICSEEFELKPDKPGFANQCPECSAREPGDLGKKRPVDATQRKTEREANEARRQAMRDLLYRKDS